MDLHGLNILMISILHKKKHEGQRGDVPFLQVTVLISGSVGTLTQIFHSSKPAILLSYPQFVGPEHNFGV